MNGVGRGRGGMASLVVGERGGRSGRHGSMQKEMGKKGSVGLGEAVKFVA